MIFRNINKFPYNPTRCSNRKWTNANDRHFCSTAKCAINLIQHTFPFILTGWMQSHPVVWYTRMKNWDYGPSTSTRKLKEVRLINPSVYYFFYDIFYDSIADGFLIMCIGRSIGDKKFEAWAGTAATWNMVQSREESQQQERQIINEIIHTGHYAMSTTNWSIY